MTRPPVRVLLAEDEEHLGTILETFLRGRGQIVTRVRDGRAALDALRARSFDVALLDIVMPELDGLEVLRSLGTLPAPPEAIVMTGNGTMDTAVTAIQLGAYDYLAKPYRMAEVDLLISRAAEKRALRLATAARRWAARRDDAAFLTRIPELADALAGAERAARAGQGGPWIISGPPGSGRRALARWLHARSPLAGEPTLLFASSGNAAADAAALFGAPTDAGAAAGYDALGALEAAGRGMVVVDGWCRLDPSLRDSLQRALVEGQFRRGGADAEAQSSADAWVAASVALDARVCLCVDDPATAPASLRGAAALVVQLPPLAARAGDIRLLAEHFLRSAGPAELELAGDAAAALDRHDWPGQVAELRDVIRAAAWRASGSDLRAAHLALPALAGIGAGAAVGAEDPGGRIAPGGIAAPARAAASLAELERDQIAAVLEEVAWHRERAAARLGISVRTLYRRIRQLGLSPRRAGAEPRTGGPGSGAGPRPGAALRQSVAAARPGAADWHERGSERRVRGR